MGDLQGEGAGDDFAVAALGLEGVCSVGVGKGYYKG